MKPSPLPNSADSALIRTKLMRPPVQAGLVERPHLLARLDDVLARRVTLVSAPPGFGKTTLAVQWLEQRAVPWAWLALDPFDSDPERFVTYLVAAVGAATPGRCPGTAALLAARTPPPFGHVIETFVAEVAGIETPLVLVLEDYHAVASTAVQQLMERLVPALPASVHLLVLTRVDPPWPLGLWLAKGWMAELRARDLRFSRQEARRFFAGERAGGLSEEAIGHVYARTEGWIAGLRLLEVSLHATSEPDARARAFSGSERLVADYLITEVLASQPAEVRAFLEATAPLDRFCVPLADHLLVDRGEPMSAREALDHLERENLFVVPLGADGQWYRYHHLFRDLLLHHLPSLASVERRATIGRRAAEWFANEGLIEEALRHWIDAGEIDAAAACLGERLGSVIDEDVSRRALSRMLALFPPGAERGRLPLLVAHVYVKGARWDTAGVAELVEQVDALGVGRAGGAPKDLNTRLQAAADVHKAGVTFWRGESEEAARIAAHALERLPLRGWGFARSVGTAYRAIALALSGRRGEGLREVERAAARGSAAAGRQVVELLFVEGLIRLYASQLDEIEVVGRRMLAAHAVAPAPAFWLGWVHYLLGVVAYERNQMDGAEAAFQQVASQRYLVSSRLVHDAMIGLCLVARARGADQEVKARAAEARAYALEVGDPVSFQLSDSLEARLALSDGTRGLPAVPPADFMFFWLEVPSLTYADGLLRAPSAESRDAALPFIERALEQANGHYNVRQAVPFSLLRAEALALRGDEEAALKTLGTTVRRAEPLGLVRTFLDRGPRLMQLVYAFAERAGRRGYLDRLLSACEERTEAGQAAGDSGRLVGPAGRPAAAFGVGSMLSNREIDVLELLAERLSNKEIAARLGVSPETVKVHTRHIYEKLAVHDRHEAVAAARTSGLIGPR